MAELGSFKTEEAYLRSMSEPPYDSLERLVSDYQNYAKSQTQNDLAFDALLHAGELSFKILRNYPNAQFIYENILARANRTAKKHGMPILLWRR